MTRAFSITGSFIINSAFVFTHCQRLARIRFVETEYWDPSATQKCCHLAEIGRLSLTSISVKHTSSASGISKKYLCAAFLEFCYCVFVAQTPLVQL